MSAAGLAAVSALDNRATELFYMLHFARCAEKRDAAVAASQTLGNADCLITAALQADAADDWIAHANAPGVAEADKCAALCHAFEVLCAAIPTLQRRKAAGTLMAGSCRPVEEACNAVKLRYRAARWGIGAASVAVLTPLIGYEAYLYAASNMLHLLFTFQHGLFGAGCQVDLAQCVRYVVSAADIVALPRDHSFAVHAEITLVSIFQGIVFARESFTDATAYQLLRDAWDQLLRSGVLRQRGLERAAMEHTLDSLAVPADLQRRYAAAVLRACALPACAAREVHPAQFKKCAACQAVVYCCKRHQTEHWPAHKAACKAARKAAAQCGAGPSGSA
jgi:hypothetical protein